MGNPRPAVTSITAALSAMSKDGTIYVKPRTTVAAHRRTTRKTSLFRDEAQHQHHRLWATYGNPNNRTGVQLKP